MIVFLPKRRQIMERRPALSYLWPGEERRYAKRESKIVLATYHVVRSQYPLLTGKALYEMVVAHQTGVSADDAKAMVRVAEQSFAEWPSDRDLTFRDVVHYLCFESFVKSHDNNEWTRTSLREVVDSVIPKEL
jgi:hypothetical protein